MRLFLIKKLFQIKVETRSVSGKLNQYRLFISAKYLNKIQELTKAYISKSMLYKIGL